MKVAFVSQYFDMVLPPHQNSIGIWTYEVARRVGQHAETTVIARRGRNTPAQLTHDDVLFEFVSCAPVRVWNAASQLWALARPRANALFAQDFYAAEFLAQIKRRIGRLRPDVIHLQNFPQYAPAIRSVAPGAVIILHMHCDWLDQLDYGAMKRSIEAVDLVAGCSEHVANAARKRFAGLNARFAVLPNGVTCEPIPTRGAHRVADTVLFVGRVSPEKGLHTLLEAWPKVVAARPNAKLDIVGPLTAIPRGLLIDLSRDPDVVSLSRFYSRDPNSYYSALRAMIPRHLVRTINFVGYEPHERIMVRCAQSSILVCPSLSESFGMSLIEALSVETPVIATRVGGMPEIIEATGGGQLIDKNNPDALANAIIGFLAAPEASAEMGRIGAKRVAERYSWSRVTDLTLELYRSAAIERTGPKNDAALSSFA